ncbi:2'-5' RNA ligase family protein [Streptomyces alfalfae]|uniref:2'-5' RNA ligase family protein n=1 Tax=Streptomyces alfalfae TaxID=1642299 RepID=A0A7T4PEV9_9ACTN|nr:2'-5' RNA ligase family protein [Streptomyces alfalfae]
MRAVGTTDTAPIPAPGASGERARGERTAGERARGGQARGEPADAGWPDLPGDTVLTIRVPEADHLVRAGFPAHITVLYPFLGESRFDDSAAGADGSATGTDGSRPESGGSRSKLGGPGAGSVHAELVGLFAAHAPFTLTFTRFRRYPGVLYLPPAPEAPLRALTEALTARWPEAVPYRGIFDPPLAPHLTLANHEGPDTYEAAYDALERELAPHLPLVSRVSSVDLLVTDGPGKGWREFRSYRLGGAGEDPA